MAKSKRDSITGRFVLGRRAFEMVSAVEDIHPSEALRRDLSELAEASDHARRTTILRKYGTSKSGRAAEIGAKSKTGGSASSDGQAKRQR